MAKTRFTDGRTAVSAFFPTAGLVVPQAPRGRPPCGARRRVPLLCALLAALLLAAACGEGESPAPATPAPAPPVPAPPEPPAVPADLRVSGSSDDWIEWSWSAVAGVSGYEVQSRIGGSPTDGDETVARTAEQLSYRREGLGAETTVHLRVRSVAGNGADRRTSGWSAPVGGSTAAPLTGAARDRATLVRLYEATGGPGWSDATNWLTDLPLDQWRGVTVTDDGRVSALRLRENRLDGPLIPELAELAGLNVLSLGENRLNGSLPPELGQLASLEYLYLNANELNGAIPTELRTLERLVVLNLGANELTGSIPTQLGSLANLVVLNLAANELSGSIPSQLGQLANLAVLNLGANELTGSIPPQLRQLTGLERLYLNGNALSGRIPTQLSRLESVEVLILANNALTGAIPAQLGQLANLRILNLNGNRLTGRIPPQLGQLASLMNLYLGSNRLSGPIPAALTTLDLAVLNLWSSGVCIPDDPRIREWLQAIDTVQISGVPDCPP